MRSHWGEYVGAALRMYDGVRVGNVIGDFDYHNKMCKMDGRLPHEVVLSVKTTLLEHDLQFRSSVVWFKSYDHRKNVCDPIFDTPHFALIAHK